MSTVAAHPVAPGTDRAPDFVARAEAMLPGLVAEQAETERRTFYSEQTHEAFRAAGFYRMLVPSRYGGYETGVDTFLEVVRTIARGCPSTGWMYLFGAAHALVAATLFEERAQAELFAGGDFICPATVAPAGSAQRDSDGSWIVSGTFKYCSGSPYATHFIGHTLVDRGNGPEPLMFAARRDQWRRLDDWGDTLGLRGSGSHSLVLSQARIPAHLTLDTHLSQVDVATTAVPGRRLHGGAQYGGGPLSFMLLELGALAVGMAQGALDAYEDLMRSRTTAFLPIVPRPADPMFQQRYGDASGMIGTAAAAMSDAVRQWQRDAERGPAAITRERELQLAMISRESVKLAWGAVERHLFPTAGSSEVRSGRRIERVWRDMSMLHSHAGVAVFLSFLANGELTGERFDAR